MSGADRNFVLQQGFPASAADGCERFSSALVFQARILLLVVLVGTVTQQPVVFAFLAVLLWWCALVPRLNPFDALYNRTVGRRPGAPRLTPAPPPRRFAQGMAACFATGAALALAANLRVTAWVLEAFFFVALGSLLLGRLCLGSFVYHLVMGRVGFAMRTLPWNRSARV